MSDPSTLQQRVERMLAAGTLTPAEAQRLHTTLHEAATRDAPQQAAARSTRAPLWLMLGLLVLGFALGGTGGWLLAPAAPDVSAVALQAPLPPAPQRVIPLSELDIERSATMNRVTPLLLGVIPITLLALVGLGLVLSYNSLVTSREQVNAGWAQVENVYQRRLDLVPVLVDTVREYADHERGTLTALTEARANALRVRDGLSGDAPSSTEQLRAIDASQGQVGATLSRLLAVVENYPELRASRNFVALQDQLEGTENRVAMERRNYNEFSRRYNTRLQTFPSNLVAQLAGFVSKPYFQAETAALEAPDDPFERHAR